MCVETMSRATGRRRHSPYDMARLGFERYDRDLLESLFTYRTLCALFTHLETLGPRPGRPDLSRRRTVAENPNGSAALGFLMLRPV